MDTAACRIYTAALKKICLTRCYTSEYVVRILVLLELTLYALTRLLSQTLLPELAFPIERCAILTVICHNDT